MEARFLFETSELEILNQLEAKGSLRETALELGRDLSVVNRQISRMEEKAKVIEKVPDLPELLSATKAHHVKLISQGQSIEESLLKGDADFGFDCGKPVSPLVRFRQVLEEPFVVVASSQLIRSKKLSIEELVDLPHLKFSRILSSEALTLGFEVSNIFGEFNDIAAVRSACLLGLGWAILPAYTVRDEVKSKQLQVIDIDKIKLQKQFYSVWWLRERKSVLPAVEAATKWLHRQSLGS